MLLMSDLDPSGNLNAQGIFNYSEALKLKYAVQVGSIIPIASTLLVEVD